MALIIVSNSLYFCIGYLYCITFFTLILKNDILQRALLAVTKNCKNSDCSIEIKIILVTTFREVITVGGYPLAYYCVCICNHCLCIS